MEQNVEVPGFALPGVLDTTRRDFPVGGAAVLLFAGCGPDSFVGLEQTLDRLVEEFSG